MIATPVKFRAPSLSRPAALDVGKVTFKLFTKIEWVIFLLLGIPILFCTPSFLFWSVLALLLGILCAQRFWMLPILADRADAAASENSALPKSSAHRFYVIAELAKLLLLIVIAWKSWSAVSGIVSI